MLEFPQPDRLPCPECGASVARGDSETHACDEERRLDYLVIQHRDELERFDEELGAWLDSPAGQFAAWLAERGR
jgi:hypothetical protein